MSETSSEPEGDSEGAVEPVRVFERDGFVVVPDLLDADEIDHFAPLVDAAVRRRMSGDTRSLAERSRYEQSFLQCINLWEDHPELRGLTFHPRIAETAAELLGAARVRLWHDQALYKEAGGRETDAHQDLPYWPIHETSALTAWIPFDDITETNGPLAFVPGSHHFGLRKFINLFFGEPEDLLAHSRVRDVEPIQTIAKRGSVLFHHALTIHLAARNHSERPRRVHTAIFFADGVTRSLQGIHPSVDRAGITPGEAIASDATPIAWPRASGDLPATPSTPIAPDTIGRHLWPPNERTAAVGPAPRSR
jgi:ectoine hydroxylase-related dioxygenase (phytanoyl-CoA dioxygenase family)